jgi:hypothetical protein
MEPQHTPYTLQLDPQDFKVSNYIGAYFDADRKYQGFMHSNYFKVRGQFDIVLERSDAVIIRRLPRNTQLIIGQNIPYTLPFTVPTVQLCYHDICLKGYVGSNAEYIEVEYYTIYNREALIRNKPIECGDYLWTIYKKGLEIEVKRLERTDEQAGGGLTD